MGKTALPVVFLAIGASASSMSAPMKWDYVRKPVQATENRPAPLPVFGLSVAGAFDGFGATGSSPAATKGWVQNPGPSDGKPVSCDIDYGKSVLPSAFVHYFYTPESKDFRYNALGPSAFKTVSISSSDDGKTWRQANLLKDLPESCPQILATNAEAPARYWRIEVLDMCPGAGFVCAYEMETWLGGVPRTLTGPPAGPDFQAQFRKRCLSEVSPLALKVAAAVKDGEIGIALGQKGTLGSISAVVNGKPAQFRKAGALWAADISSGKVVLSLEESKIGQIASFRFQPKSKSSLRYENLSLQFKVTKPEVYYVPAYQWTRKPIDMMANVVYVQTRMVSFQKQGKTICLIPGSDRGAIGFVGGVGRFDTVIGPKPTPVLLAAVKGDWWSAYIFAVRDIYGFVEPHQSYPVSEIQYGISKYLMRDEVWDKDLGTVKSWPERDPHNSVVGYMDAFGMYGAPYSLPAYWSRYVMNDDREALKRMTGVAHWLCRSGLRVQDGPCKGAFFNLQRFPTGQKHNLDRVGSTQASTTLATSQSTGAALWTLVYYNRFQPGDAEVVDAIKQAAEWLVKTQGADGSWPYGHTLDGKAVAGASSSGAIWNIWALHRMAHQFPGDSRLAPAVQKALQWYRKTFVDEHHYHGYWEDVGQGSREGYEAALAAVAFDDMGLPELSVAAAKDGLQWVFTRQIECRESSDSAGLVAEQTGWPPASYCNPMMGLAGWVAWKNSGDDFFKPFANIPKAIGWWYQPETGAMVWIVDSTQPAPVFGSVFESWWNDWCIAQVGTLTQRWLVRQVNARSAGTVHLDEESLVGKAFGQNVRAWSAEGGLSPILPTHGQINWLCCRSEGKVWVVFLNDGSKGNVLAHLDSRKARGTMVWPDAYFTLENGKAVQHKWDGIRPVPIGDKGVTVLQWGISGG